MAKARKRDEHMTSETSDAFLRRLIREAHYLLTADALATEQETERWIKEVNRHWEKLA